MTHLSDPQKYILKLAYDNLKQNHIREYKFVIKNSKEFYLVNALRSLNDNGYIKAISDNFYDNVISVPPLYEFALTLEGELLAESL